MQDFLRILGYVEPNLFFGYIIPTRFIVFSVYSNSRIGHEVVVVVVIVFFFFILKCECYFVFNKYSFVFKVKREMIENVVENATERGREREKQEIDYIFSPPQRKITVLVSFFFA